MDSGESKEPCVRWLTRGRGNFGECPQRCSLSSIFHLFVLLSAIVAAVHIVACYFGEWQYVEFLATSSSMFSSGTPHSKWVSDYIVKMDGPGLIEAGTTGSWNNVPMVIPPIVPSRLAGCGIINVNYVLKVGHSFIPFSTRPLDITLNCFKYLTFQKLLHYTCLTALFPGLPR